MARGVKGSNKNRLTILVGKKYTNLKGEQIREVIGVGCSNIWPKGYVSFKVIKAANRGSCLGHMGRIAMDSFRAWAAKEIVN